MILTSRIQIHFEGSQNSRGLTTRRIKVSSLVFYLCLKVTNVLSQIMAPMIPLLYSIVDASVIGIINVDAVGIIFPRIFF